MALTNIFSKLKQRKLQKQALMLSGYTPIFSSYGDNIYASDVVQSCIRCKAAEISKLTPKHIRVDSETGMQTGVNGSINRLLKFAPNPLMTTKDYLEKIIWLLELTNNAFIYPTYINAGDTRTYTGLYPLNPRVVEFMQDESEALFIKMTFGNGQNYTLPYADVIHIRKDYSLSDILGGDENGQPINKSLLKVLETENTVIQGIGNAVKASLAVRVILKQNSLLSDEKLQQEQEKFLKAIKANESGILPMDLKSEYTPVPLDPKLIDKDTMEFLQSKILNSYGVSLPILSGDFTEEQYQAFYEKTLESIIIALGQAHSKTLFTERELQFGNEVIFYPQRLNFASTTTKIALADILGNRGALTDNQLLELFGYPPYEGGNKRKQSLNFIDCDIANDYQLSKQTNTKGVVIDGQSNEPSSGNGYQANV